MKTQIFFTAWLLFISATLSAQEYSEKITKEFSFEKKGDLNALMIDNINGSVSVEAYDGDKIQVEVTKTIHGKTQQRLQAGKSEVLFSVVDLADTLILYVATPCHRFEKAPSQPGKSHMGTRWGYACNNRAQACHEMYEYTMNFLVRIPATSNLLVSTINNGDIIVTGVKGVVKADNINGSIRLENLIREADAHTINGNVDVTYVKNPERPCRFYSLNGDINALFKKGLAANISFDSFNGSFYSNIDRLEKLPVHVSKNKNDRGLQYKVENNRYQAGSGGAFLDFETFNGNVYLKEN